MERAEKLATLLSETSLNKIYSTNYKRTIQTATPTANKQNLTIVNYEALEHDKLIEDILENNKEGKVLVVGHSNTIPNFLNTLTNTSDYPELSEDAYDNLYIVHTKSKGDSEVINLKF